MPTSEIHVFGKDAVIARFAKIVSNLPAAVLTAMKTQMVALADYVRVNKLSGQVLNRRSGNLSRSITGQAEITGFSVVGTMGSKGVPYAGIHEFGAVFTREITQAFGRPIVPVMATFHYPERAFLRPSARENQDKINAALRAAVIGVLNAS